jgi:putative transposase
VFVAHNPNRIRSGGLRFASTPPYGIPRVARGERGIWQRRFWEHLIRDEADYARHVEYCYINPVKHGLVERVHDWPHSSFHRDATAGIVPLDWAGNIDPAGDFGER